MKRMKRLIAMLVAVAALAAVSVPALAANAAYSDLKNHWAETYMEDLSDRGYLNGYPDGTMKPDKTITAAEAVALLSRFYQLSDADADAVYGDYGKKAESILDKSMSWLYDEAALCMAAGIVRESELKAMKLSNPIQKELLSVFIVRAMGMADDAKALAYTSLSFDDTEQISAECINYVQILVNAEVIEGNTKNQFEPHSNVTRAVVAKMLSVGIGYLEENDRMPVLADYNGRASYEGVVTAVSSTTASVRCTDGLTRVFNTASVKDVTVGGATGAITSAAIGAWAKVNLNGGQVIRVAVTTGGAWAQGSVRSTTTASGVVTLTITGASGSEKYTITDADVYVNGKKAESTDLESGMAVSVQRSSAASTDAIRVYAVASTGTISGTVGAFNLEALTFNLLSEDGTYSFALELTDLPTIRRNGDTVTLDRLANGDSVTVTHRAGELSTITITGSEDTYTGTLQSTSATSEGTVWKLGLSDGSTVTLRVSDSARAYSGSTSILISSVTVGTNVTVKTYDDAISEVYTDTSVTTADEITGSVVSVNNQAKTLTLLTGGKWVTVNCKAVGTYITTAGRSIKLLSIDAGDSLTVYGSYATSTEFAATAVILKE